MSDAWTNATPMRNADFKALLATPRPAGATQQQQHVRSSGAAGSFKHPKARSSVDDDEEGGGKKFKKPAPKRPGGKPGKDKDKEDGPKYRDRAKERREGANVDFDEAEADLAARGLGAANLQNLSIEQSKFLGGDIAHTHLVKGLDYALLQQERQKLEAGGGSSLAAAAAPSAAAAVAAEAAAAAATAAAAAAKAPVSFVSAQGRALFNAVFRPPHNRTLVREMFQPRRTAFVFEFDSPVASDVPTTLRRSKADCPSVQDVVTAASDAPLLERISKIMSYINQTTSGKGGKRSARDSQYIRSILTGVSAGDAQVHGQLVMKGQGAITAAAAASAAAASAAAAATAGGGGGSGGGAAPAAPAAPAAAAAAPADDDDIFGDAGTDYAPVIPAAKKGAAEGNRRAEGLFAGSDHQEAMQAAPAAAAAAGRVVDMDTEEGELPGQRQMQLPGPPSDEQQQQQQQQQQGLQGFQSQQQYYGQFMQQPAAEEPKWRVRTKPGAAAALQGFADDAYDDCFPGIADYGGDDDEELDAKAAKAGEEGAEGAAAAGGKKGGKKGGAAGAGGGMDDGERKLKQKLNKEVQQMQGIFKEKGWGSEAAFKKPDRLEAVSATPARKRLRI